MADIIELIYADHDWFRRQFFHLDEARTPDELSAAWTPLARRLEIHAQAEETVFYPALLERGEAGDPVDETDDALHDHNKIRDAVRRADDLGVGTDEWREAVEDARRENGEHLEEEEREALPDFIKSASLELRHELASAWLRFYDKHTAGTDVQTENVDVEEYIEQHG